MERLPSKRSNSSKSVASSSDITGLYARSPYQNCSSTESGNPSPYSTFSKGSGLSSSALLANPTISIMEQYHNQPTTFHHHYNLEYAEATETSYENPYDNSLLEEGNLEEEPRYDNHSHFMDSNLLYDEATISSGNEYAGNSYAKEDIADEYPFMLSLMRKKIKKGEEKGQ